MRYRDKKSYYERAAPVREICNLLTNDGECALRDVEVGARFATEDDRTNVRIHRRNFVPQNAAQLRNHFTSRKTALSLEVGMILPKMPPGLKWSVQMRRDYMKNRVDTFMVGKPLVFDWDIDTEKRTKWNGCQCPKKVVCAKCWEAWAEPARVALLRMLRYWMGFKHVVCVFSGRRGFHLWVLDQGSRDYTLEQRTSILHKIGNPVKGAEAHQDIISLMKPYYEKYHQHRSYGVEELMYALDAAPTIQYNHFIGVPLVPHPVTGMMRVPIDVVNFNPERDGVKCIDVSHERMRNYAKRFKKRKKIK